MSLRIIVILIISHLLGDFVFQTDAIAELRSSNVRSERCLANAKHSFIHFITLILIFCVGHHIFQTKLRLGQYFILVSLIPLSHFLIDVLKSFIITSFPKCRYNMYIFLGDQVLHIMATLFAVTSTFDVSMISMINKIPSDFFHYLKYLAISDKILIIILIYIFCMHPVGIFIGVFVKHINPPNNNKEHSSKIDSSDKSDKQTDFYLYHSKDFTCALLKDFHSADSKNENTDTQESEKKDGAEKGGFIIGLLERLFILIAFSINAPSMIGFVLTAKSLARFKKLDNSTFAEYFIIGTFISFIFAIVGGILIRSLNLIPIIK